MATLHGQIRRAGQGVPGLRVVGYEEIQVGYEVDDTPPCQLGPPSVEYVGDDLTDDTGRFRIEYTPREDPDECGFRAVVRVRIFEGATALWQSPNKIAAASVRFDFDIPAPPPPLDPEGEARVFGVLTRCGQPATGYRIVAFEEVRHGYPYLHHPCVEASPVVRNLGTVVVGPDGSFEIRYTPTEPDEGACSFAQTVQVQAFEGTTPVWRSAARPYRKALKFDHELYPGCQSGSTMVRVLDEVGRRREGAEVFVNGELRGLTDSLGQLFVPSIAAGDALTARVRLRENPTDRQAHAAGSDRNWNYRVYITSLSLTYDANGDDPAFQPFIVGDSSAVQDLIVRRRNVLFGFNLVASVEWDATASEMVYFRDRLLETSELIFNGTDGQFLIEQFSIADSGTRWVEADIRIYADWSQRSETGSNIAETDGPIRMNPFDAFYPGVFFHELGHYAFYLSDEYAPLDCWTGQENPFCTLASDPNLPPTPFTDGQGKDSCLMRGSQYKNQKKFCSRHPANPHVDCTWQGPVDCWTTIAQHYWGFSAWRLQSPNNRGVIVDRLPDSGLPLGTTTAPPPGEQIPRSYVPLAGWKTRAQVLDVARSGERPGLIVRTLYNGAPLDGVRVTLHTTDGRILVQGRTQDKDVPGSVSTGEGGILVRGAHIGDVIRAVFSMWPFTLRGRATVPAGTDPLVIDLTRDDAPLAVHTTPVGIDQLHIEVIQSSAVERPIVSMRNDGNSELIRLVTTVDPARAFHSAVIGRVAVDHECEFFVTGFDDKGKPSDLQSRMRASRVLDGEHVIRSAGAELRILLTDGSLSLPAQVVVEDAGDVPLPELSRGDRLLVTPQRVLSSQGNELRKPVQIVLAGPHLNRGPGPTKPASELELLRYEGKAGWRTVKARLNVDPPTASAVIDRLGVFALVSRR